MDKDLNASADIRKKLYIKLYYSMLDWEWYDDPNTFRVFMHLLLIANRKDNRIHGKIIHRGEALASVDYLATQLKLSRQNIRTALNHLKSTGEITIRKIANISVIQLKNYDKYQSANNSNNNSVATASQKDNKSLTTPIYCKNDKNDILQECVQETRAHGRHNNVLLTDYEYENFIKRYPLIAQEIIEELSDKIATGDSRYQKGHIGHLYVFARNYTPKKQSDEPSYDIEKALQRSLNLDPTKTKKGE